MRGMLAALVLGLALACGAHAQPARLLPANGKVGELSGRQHAFPLVEIGSQVKRLAAGALIYDRMNRTIVHGMLPEKATILYVEAPGGDVSRIYILRPDELERITRESKR
ncbi:MAG: hypothetical protein IT529_02275 [Burkholderiales bacterium]|nr:hypothetical protein [Burkholderiales bacterium]